MIRALRPGFAATISVFAFAACLTLSGAGVPGQPVLVSTEDYLMPPARIANILTAEAMHSRVSLNNLGPDGEHFLIPRSMGMLPSGRWRGPT